MELAVHELPHGLRLHVHGLQRAAVFDVGHALAVGTVRRLHVDQRRLHQLLLLELCGVGELLLVLVHDARLVDLPKSATLRGVDKAAAVGREVDIALLLRRVGDSLCRGVVCRRDVDVAVHHEGYFLARWRHRELRGAASQHLSPQLVGAVVGNHREVESHGLAALLEGVDGAVVGVAQRAVGGAREEPDGIALVVGELRLGRLAYAALVDVEGAVFLAKIIIRVVVAAPYRRAVLAGEIGQLGVVATLVEPDVAADGRLVVFAERVLVAFVVVVEQGVVVAHADVFHRYVGEEAHASAFVAHLIDLREVGEHDARGLRHDRGFQHDGAVVSPSHGVLVATVGRNPSRRATVPAHHVDVHAALAA